MGPLIKQNLNNDANWNWINVGSGKGLLPDSTKPLSELMLTYSDNVLKRHMTQCIYVSVNWVIIGSGNSFFSCSGPCHYQDQSC